MPRATPSLFDVSHLGTRRVDGPRRARRCCSGRSPTISTGSRPGRAQYTHLLDPDDAHVVDDIIVWWVGDERVPRDAERVEHRRLAAALRGAWRSGGECTSTDITARRAVLAVQGPKPASVLARASPPTRPRSRGSRCSAVGSTATRLRRRHRLHGRGRRRAPRARAGRAGGAGGRVLGAGITPAGLGARDTLRLEAGLPLHGHELGPGITPLQAGLGWVVRFDKGDFRGRARSAGRAGARGRPPAARPASLDGRQIPRAGCAGAAWRDGACRRGHERQLLARCSSGGSRSRSLRPTSTTAPR